MKTRTELINFLIKKNSLKTYLEIGVQGKVNFRQIVANRKVCVDPDPKAEADYIMTSDDFFAQNKSQFDLVFIDGLHHYEQVKRDFENALKIISDNGFIVFHDTYPAEEIHTRVPRETQLWNGDVYRLACELQTYDGIGFETYTFDHGCTVVWKDPNAKGSAVNETIDFSYFRNNAKKALRAVE